MRVLIFGASLLHTVFASPLCKVTDSGDSAPIVQTTTGLVRGCEDEGGGVAFTIPFAEPPIDELRFKAPQPKQPWSGIYDGTKFATMCPQFSGSYESQFYLGDEDCLYLNVHQPPSLKNSTEPIPVLFWIYGGAFMIGDSYEFGWYDPKDFVDKHDVIIVSHNYRVGPFGFLAHEALQAEDAADSNVAVGSTGNMGLRDQRLAMQWVQDNIANFGGDPSRVTIYGESAGAISVCSHVANKQASESLFASAIMESGTCDSPELFLQVDQAMAFGDDFSRLVVGCDSETLGSDEAFLDCMRSVPATDLLYGALKGLEPLNETQKAQFSYIPPLFPLVPFTLVVDGAKQGIPELPLTSMRNGDAMAVPMIQGTNKDEGTIFVPFVKSCYDIEVRMNFSDLVTALEDIICTEDFPGADCDIYATLEQYGNCTGYKSVDACAAAVLRDYIFTCPTRRSTAAMSAMGQDVYQYQFTYDSHWEDMKVLGNYHTSELYFVWDNPWPLRNNKTEFVHDFDENDNQMAATFGNYWANLARYGTPNGDGSSSNFAEWPSVVKDANSLDGMSHMAMELPNTVEYALEDQICDYWDLFLGFTV